MVACPKLVKFYNMHMGSVDLLDSILGYYRIRIRSKKWYHQIVFHLPDLSIVNAWLLWKRKTNSDLPLIEFKLGIADRLCMVGKIPQTRGKGHPSTLVEKTVHKSGGEVTSHDDVCYDNVATYHYGMTSVIGAREKDVCLSVSLNVKNVEFLYV